MKNLGNLLIVAGVLLVIYSVIGRFVSDTTIGANIVVIEAKTGLIAANSLLLIGIAAKLWNKD